MILHYILYLVHLYPMIFFANGVDYYKFKSFHLKIEKKNKIERSLQILLLIMHKKIKKYNNEENDTYSFIKSYY